MNTTKMLLSLAAGALLLGACNRDKPAAEQAATTPTADTAVVLRNRDTAAYRANAQRLAQRVGQDLGITDAVVITRLVPVYIERETALSDIGQQHATDTTGQYTARRAANDAATARVKTIVGDSVKYQAYASGQGNYYDGGPFTAPAAPAPVSRVGAAPAKKASLGVGKGSGIKKLENDGDGDKKVKYQNGAKIKRNEDGSVKIKRADGTKVKIDENGHKTVKKPLL